MKYAVWDPVVRFFVTIRGGGQLLLFSDKRDAESYTNSINISNLTAGTREAWRVVPWDEQAQFIANGGKP